MPKRARAGQKSIALVGMMGVGKSSVGRRLAQRLPLPFVDADVEIEREAGLAIPEIFERFGEARFREAERRTIARLIERPACVIATGGGAFVDPATRALILENCTAVWLDADLDTIVERVSPDGGRPLLNGRNPRDALAALAAQREPFYAQAHIAVRNGRLSLDAIVDRILVSLSGRVR